MQVQVQEVRDIQVPRDIQAAEHMLVHRAIPDHEELPDSLVAKAIGDLWAMPVHRAIMDL